MRRPLAVCAVCLLGTAAHAQWSSDPNSNTPVSTAPGDQINPKLVAGADGSCLISWLDAPSGYDLRLQRLDGSGTAQWPADGIVVADRSLSWVQDYGLDVDAQGRTLLACRDESAGETRVLAQLVGTDGSLPWGAGGVELDASSSAFLAAPETAATSDGGYVVAWTRDAAAVLNKLDASGARDWAGEVMLFDPDGDSYSVSDLRTSDAGSVVVSLISEIFMAHRYLRAQKLAADGSLLWGAAEPFVYDGGSLQLGNYPEFVTDGAGGAVFSWYQAATPLQARAQRLLADGSEAFAHDGVELATNPTRQRTSPSADCRDCDGELYTFWVEDDLGQSQRGVYGQRIAAPGTRVWGADGVEVEPVDTSLSSNVATLALADGVMTAYLEHLESGIDLVRVARFDPDGNLVCRVDASTAASAKSDLQATLVGDQLAVLVWSDARDGNLDVYAQSVDQDCQLGGAPAQLLLRRGSVAELSPGWRSTALPLSSLNDDRTPPFPYPATQPGSVADGIVTSDPLQLYRLLTDADTALGNSLLAAKNGAAVEISY